MRIDVVSIFPQMFDAVRGSGMTRIALERKKLQLELWDPRNFCEDRYRRVDERPYGGGPGMVMQAPPLAAAIRAARSSGHGRVICLSPQGPRLTQERVRSLAGAPALVLLAGRYEGIDQRLLDKEVDEEVSIGDYVLAGGELPAMVLIEALVRYLPGVLGNAGSVEADSFSDDMLDWPHYTRPEDFEGARVPAPLLTGNHEEIRRWRLTQALGQTWLRRPDLLAQKQLTEEERQLLAAFRKQYEEQESSE